MATIQDVAKNAGVSTTTVSHVLNKTRSVDPSTRARVMCAVADLGYRPNRLARGLRRRETHTIGLLVPDNSNPFFAELARAIEDAFFIEGYSVVLCNSDQSETKELAYVETLLAKQVDGLVLASGSSHPDAIMHILADSVPVVVLPGALTSLPVDHVLSDDVAGGRQVADYLLGLGHERIGCIAGPRTGTASSGRLDGFRQVLAERGCPIPDTMVVQGDFRFRGGEIGMTELLRGFPDMTAVFAANDLMALGALRAIRRAGRRTPDDISLIGFDGTWIGAEVTPALTTIAQPITELAHTSMRLLLERIRGDTRPPRRVLLPTDVIERESCRRLRDR